MSDPVAWGAIICAICRSSLDATFETDGHGAIVTVVYPCTRCRRDVRRILERDRPQPTAPDPPPTPDPEPERPPESPRDSQLEKPPPAPRPRRLVCDCGKPIDYPGRGRPPERCASCREKRRKRALGWA